MTTGLRVVFMGSPPFGAPVLEAVLASEHELVLVVTRPDRPRGRGRSVERGEVARLADVADIPVLQPESTRDGTFAEALRSHTPDVLLVASYGEILNEEVLAVPRIAPLNVHASLLPRHRGSSPIQAAIQSGDAKTGVSVQRMVLALDAGDLLLDRELTIGATETAGELHDRLALLGGEAAAAALDELAGGAHTFRPQDESAVTLTRRLKKDDGRIDFVALDAAALVRHVRAMTPWPGARTELWRGTTATNAGASGPSIPDRAIADGAAHDASSPGSSASETGAAMKRRAGSASASGSAPADAPLPLTIHAAATSGDLAWAGAQPGDLRVVDGRLLVALRDGTAELTRVQPAGKRPMDAAEFLRGARLAPNARLGGTPCPD